MSGYGANFTVGYEHAVCDSTHRGICKLPRNVLGNICSRTNKVGAESGELNSAAGSVIIVFSSDISTNKLTGGRSGRNNQNAVGSRTLCAIGRRAVYFKLFTGTLRKERGRSAAVTVNRYNAAERKHELCHFIAGEAYGIGSLTTVVHYHYKGTVFFDTNERTGCAVVRIVILAVLVFTVFNKETEVCGNNLFFPSGNCGRSRADLNLRHILGTCYAVFFIKVDDNASLRAGSLALAVYVNFAVENHIAERFAYKLGMCYIVCRIIPAK